MRCREILSLELLRFETKIFFFVIIHIWNYESLSKIIYNKWKIKCSILKFCIFKVKIFKQINKENKNYVNNIDFYEKYSITKLKVIFF